MKAKNRDLCRTQPGRAGVGVVAPSFPFVCLSIRYRSHPSPSPANTLPCCRFRPLRHARIHDRARAPLRRLQDADARASLRAPMLSILSGDTPLSLVPACSQHRAGNPTPERLRRSTALISAFFVLAISLAPLPVCPRGQIVTNLARGFALIIGSLCNRMMHKSRLHAGKQAIARVFGSCRGHRIA